MAEGILTLRNGKEETALKTSRAHRQYWAQLGRTKMPREQESQRRAEARGLTNLLTRSMVSNIAKNDRVQLILVACPLVSCNVAFCNLGLVVVGFYSCRGRC